MVQDSIFTTDTLAVDGYKDSVSVVKTFKEVKQREETYYDVLWDQDFLNVFKTVIKPLMDDAAK